MKPIIECIPNFSEGRDKKVIQQICAVIQSVPRVSLLHVDMGYDANRTVITFAGEPQAVTEAAFLAIREASKLIDMTQHKGEHPRIGATDVCPLVPISEISMDEVVLLARNLAERVGNELAIPVYCYEEAALAPQKRNLANCRKGEYEHIAQKINHKEWQPDFGPCIWNKQSGISVIGAREFLIAFNVTLNTENISLAKAIAERIRTSGKINPVNKEITAGLFQKLKAIAWYMPEYKAVQISMNFTNFNITGLHTVVEEIKIQASALNCQVIGSELIGLIPLNALLFAGRYYQKPEDTLSESQLIALAVENLLLDYHETFHAQTRIIEYALNA